MVQRSRNKAGIEDIIFIGKILSKALKELEIDGLLTRILYPEMPPRSQYAATSLGRSLVPVLEALIKWGEENSNFYGVEFNNARFPLPLNKIP